MTKRFQSPYADYLKDLSLPILENVCLFEAGQGKNIHGNMFALIKVLTTNDEFHGLIGAFVVTDDTLESAREKFLSYGVDGVELVIRNSRRYKELLARAHYLFTDNSFPPFFTKRPEQVYINTWHGTPLKHLGNSDLENAIASMANVQKNMLTADFVLFPNELTKHVFWDDYHLKHLFPHRFVMADYPRNDILLDEPTRERIKEIYQLRDKIVVAYMPTWRGSKRSADVEGQKRIIESILLEIDSKLPNNVVFFVNLHFLVTGGMDFSKYRHIKPFPTTVETYDFLAACDTLVTDYSSVFFDFAVTGRKIVLFAYDKQDYLENKGTYLDYDELPFPIAQTVDDLVPHLVSREYEEYPEFQREYCRYSNGHASVDLLRLAINGDSPDIIVCDNSDRKVVTALYCSSTKRAVLNDIIAADLRERNLENCIFLYSGKTGARSVELLSDISNKMPYLALVTSHVQTTKERVALAVVSRAPILEPLMRKVLNSMSRRELHRIMSDVKISQFVDLNANASYIAKQVAFSDIQCDAVLRDGSLTRIRREAQTMNLLRFCHTVKSNYDEDKARVLPDHMSDYYNGAISRATLLTRHYFEDESAIHARGLLRFIPARGIDLNNLYLGIGDDTRVGELIDFHRVGKSYFAKYDISLIKDQLINLPIHNSIRIICCDSKGLAGRSSIKFNLRDKGRSKSRVSRLFINDSTNTTSYFRQAARNTLCFTTRNTVSIDSDTERRKIRVSYILSHLIPLYRNAVVLYEKESSRYEESASVVFERLVDRGYKNAYFILDSNSPDYARVDSKYRSQVVPKNSMKHYMLFFSAKTFIGTEMLAHVIDLRPANEIVSKRLRCKNINYVFLQHGVMYMLSLDSSSRTFFKPKKINGLYRVVVSSELEKQHFVERGKYNPEYLYVCGLPKYDRNVWNEDADAIVIMPTWRPWEYNLARTQFDETGYYRFIVTAVESIPESLREKIIVLPHPLFKEAAKNESFKYKEYFNDTDESYDSILRRTKLLITDYSSIAYDAFYRGANVMFYWQDKDECLDHYGANSEIMLDEDTAFGPICYDPASLPSETVFTYYLNPQSENDINHYKKIVQFHDGHNTDRLMELMINDGLFEKLH